MKIFRFILKAVRFILAFLIGIGLFGIIIYAATILVDVASWLFGIEDHGTKASIGILAFIVILIKAMDYFNDERMEILLGKRVNRFFKWLANWDE